MNQDFRERVFLPLLLPLLLLGGFALFAVSLSRVLLAIPALPATFLALLVAGYVLVLSATLSARPHISARALGVGLVVGLVGVTTAGAIGAQAGIRELEHEEEELAEEEGTAEDEAADEEFPEDALVFAAVDIDFAEAPDTAGAGDVTIGLDNTEADLEHDVTIEDIGDVTVASAAGGDTDVGSVDLDPGTYTYYCSVPGHRDAGMEGTLEVQ